MPARRLRSDGTAGRVAAFAEAMRRVHAPPHLLLRDTDGPFWSAVASARSPVEWSPVDLHLGVLLARSLADVERLQQAIDSEGDVIDGRANPKHAIVETLVRRVIALSRLLQIHARAVAGEHRDAVKRRQAWREAVDTLAEHELDDLIPKE